MTRRSAETCGNRPTRAAKGRCSSAVYAAGSDEFDCPVPRPRRLPASSPLTIITGTAVVTKFHDEGDVLRLYRNTYTVKDKPELRRGAELVRVVDPKTSHSCQLRRS